MNQKYFVAILLSLISFCFAESQNLQFTTNDSITVKQKADLELELGDAQLYLIQQKQQIELLEKRLEESNREKSALITEANSVSVVNFDVPKSTFSTVATILIVLLLLSLLIVVVKVRSLLKKDRVQKEKYAELETEHQEHIRNALERDQKLRRQLQDEINRRNS